LGLDGALANGARAATFYTQASAYDYVHPACDTGQLQPGPATCSAGNDTVAAGGLYHFGADAQSTASLSQGLLQADVSSFGAYLGPQVNGQAVASARLFDTLTFHGPISAGETVTITMTATLTYTPYYTFSGPFGGGFGIGGASMELQGLGTDGHAIAQASYCTPNDPICQTLPGSNFGSYVISNDGNTYSISESFDLSQLADSSLEVFMQVAATSSGTGSATADDPITVSLPEGITYTSASGLFLTEVPEPGTLASFAPGLLALGLMRRRRAGRGRKSRR
jgi:hypothetical protein